MENKNHSCTDTTQSLQDSSNSFPQWMANLHESIQVELQKICLAIAEIVETDAIYSLDYCDTRNIINTGVFINEDQKKHLHFFLVVFVKEKLKYGLKLHKRIKKVMEQNISTTLLIHTTSSLQTVEKEQRNFFYQLFKQGNVAYQCKEVQSLLNTVEMPESRYDNSRIYMYVRNAAALDYLEALKTLEHNGDTMPCAVLMHLA